jgi:hypothetical protein
MKGRLIPVGRRPCVAPVSPGRLIGASVRPSPVNLPLIQVSAGASAGGGTRLIAGR